jgi:hypothetical protein
LAKKLLSPALFFSMPVFGFALAVVGSNYNWEVR